TRRSPSTWLAAEGSSCERGRGAGDPPGGRGDVAVDRHPGPGRDLGGRADLAAAGGRDLGRCRGGGAPADGRGRSGEDLPGTRAPEGAVDRQGEGSVDMADAGGEVHARSPGEAAAAPGGSRSRRARAPREGVREEGAAAGVRPLGDDAPREVWR